MDKKTHLKEDVSKYGSISGKFSEKSESVPKKKVKYTATQWTTLATLGFGNFCVGACVSLQAPFFPAEAEKKGATPTEYGFIFGVFQLTVFLTAPIIGKLVSFVSPKFLLNAGILTVGVTCILFGTLDMVNGSTKFVVLAFIIRIVEGIGSAALRTSCYTIIASQFTTSLGRTFASLETFLGVGLIVGPTLGGALYDLGGYGLPFFVIGGIVIVDAIVIYFVLPDAERTKLPEKGNLLKFWIHPKTLIYSLCIFTAFNYIGFNQATLEPHIREFHLSGFHLGLLFALSGTIYAITAPAWGWLCDKKCDCQTLSLLGSSIVVASLLLIGPAPFLNLRPHIGITIAALALMGLSIGAKLVSAFTGTLNSALERGLPAELSTYGLVSSMIASTQSLGAFIGPSLGGYLMEKYGHPNAAMTLLILEGVLILLLTITTIKRKLCSNNSTTIFNVEKHSESTRNGHLISEKDIENGIAKCNNY